MNKVVLVFICILMYGCNASPDKIFKNDKVKRLFFIFCEEILSNQERESDNIFIYANEGCTGKNCELSFYNDKTIGDNVSYGKFRYKGLNIYVSSKIHKDIIELDSYNSNLPKVELEDTTSIIDNTEMWIKIKGDSIKYFKLFFTTGDNSNNWEIAQ